jgi:hypothetical protein
MQVEALRHDRSSAATSLRTPWQPDSNVAVAHAFNVKRRFGRSSPPVRISMPAELESGKFTFTDAGHGFQSMCGRTEVARPIRRRQFPNRPRWE